MARQYRLAAVGVVAVVALVFAQAAPARADATSCQSAIVRQLAKYKKVYLRLNIKCLRLENLFRLNGPCPDPNTQLKLQGKAQKVTEAIASACTAQDMADLGFGASCALEAATQGIEGQCAALPVTTSQELADCLLCWKSAELREFIATLFASHALEACNGALDETSPACSDLDCVTPLPEQHDLGDTGENTCQIGIARGGFKYLVKREKILEACALAGGTRASCLADLQVQVDLLAAEQAKDTLISRKCGNRDPAASPPFCCKTTGNTCVVATTRDDCVMVMGGTVQEDKTCNTGTFTCEPSPGGHKVTWWEFCPESDTCPGTALSTLQDLIDCVDTSADAIVDELLCFQFPRNGGADWPCPTGE